MIKLLHWGIENQAFTLSVVDIMMLKWHCLLQVSLETLPCIIDTILNLKLKHSLQCLKYPLIQWCVHSKATTLEGAFAPAWLGFGNAYAAQDESDQAMAAYRTAARLFAGYYSLSLIIWYVVFLGFYIVLHFIYTKFNYPAFTLCTTGWLHCLDIFLVMHLHADLVACLHYFAMVCSCHLPALCIGMEYLRTNNLNLAEQVSPYFTVPILIAWNSLKVGCLISVAFSTKMICLCMFCRMMNMCGLLQFFTQAKSICPTDPLVFNELGVMAYRNKEYVPLFFRGSQYQNREYVFCFSDFESDLELWV